MAQPAVSPEWVKVHEKVFKQSESILNNWNLLNWFMTNHESAIRKRWRKRSITKRKQVLQQCWPNMPAHRRPDIAAEILHFRGRPYDRSAFLWPDINEEALANDLTFLLFLNSRGRDPPGTFIITDWNSTSYGLAMDCISRVELENYEIVFPYTAFGGYAEVLPINTNRFISGQRMCPGDGLLALEIQERLYSFLVGCAVVLLPEIPEEDYLKPPPEPPLPPPSLMEARVDLDRWRPASRPTPYQRPAEFDASRLISLVNAKCAAAEDHIWALREDPGYFASILLERKDHRPELLRHCEDNSEPQFNPDEKQRLWNRVIHSVISDAYATLGMWDELQGQLNSLMLLLAGHADELKPEEPLPVQLEEAFCKMLWALQRMCRFPLLLIQSSMQSSPSMRPYCRQLIEDDKRYIGYTSNFLKDDDRAQLFRFLSNLYHQPSRSLIGLPTLMDSLEILIQKRESIRELMSPYVMSVLSELAVLAECLREIFSFQPWATRFESTMNENSVSLTAAWNTAAKKWVVDDGRETDFTTLGLPTDSRFSYPIDTPRTAKSTARMQQSEANLDIFWDMVDCKIMENDESICRRDLFPGRLLYRTPNYQENAPVLIPSKAGPDTSHSQTDIDFELRHRTGGTKGDQVPGNKHMKVKTRGHPPPPSEINSAQSLEGGSKPGLPVNRKAFQTFKIIFGLEHGSLPGEITWKSFLQAMQEAGFKGEKLRGGSEWRFTLDGKSILFHQPHPKPKLRVLQARDYARRLENGFGLNATTFISKAK